MANTYRQRQTWLRSSRSPSIFRSVELRYVLHSSRGCVVCPPSTQPHYTPGKLRFNAFGARSLIYCPACSPRAAQNEDANITASAQSHKTRQMPMASSCHPSTLLPYRDPPVITFLPRASLRATETMSSSSDNGMSAKHLESPHIDVRAHIDSVFGFDPNKPLYGYTPTRSVCYIFVILFSITTRASPCSCVRPL